MRRPVRSTPPWQHVSLGVGRRIGACRAHSPPAPLPVPAPCWVLSAIPTRACQPPALPVQTGTGWVLREVGKGDAGQLLQVGGERPRVPGVQGGARHLMPQSHSLTHTHCPTVLCSSLKQTCLILMRRGFGTHLRSSRLRCGDACTLRTRRRRRERAAVAVALMTTASSRPSAVAAPDPEPRHLFM